MSNRKTRVKGFNLTEMMVVLVIMGILAGVVGMQVVKNIAKAKINSTKSQIAVLKNAVNHYKIDTNVYPEYLDDLVVRPADLKGWNGPYLESNAIPLDGWGFEYVYFPPEPGTAEFLIYSYGADGEEGGDGENADISNQTIVETAETGL